MMKNGCVITICEQRTINLRLLNLRKVKYTKLEGKCTNQYIKYICVNIGEKYAESKSSPGNNYRQRHIQKNLEAQQGNMIIQLKRELWKPD